MGLLEQQKQNKQLGNKGMSFIEILVVVALMVILAAGTVSIVGLISSGDAKKAAKTVVTDLTDLKNKTLSIYGSWHGELGLNSDGVLEVGIYKSDDCIQSDRLGSRVEAKFYAGGDMNGDDIVNYQKEYDLMAADNKVKLVYSQSTGAIESLQVGSDDVIKLNGNCGYIKVFAGNTVYILKLYYKTGKIVAEL